MVLIWRPDSGSEHEFTFADFTNYLDLFDQGLKLNLCVPFPNDVETPQISSKSSGDPTDHFMASGAFVASHRLRTLFERINVVAEYLPIELIHNGIPYDSSEFFIVNLLDEIACLDYEASKYTPTPNGVTDIVDLVIDDGIAQGHPLFMLGPIRWGDRPNPMAVCEIVRCASKDLAIRCFNEKVTGVAFTLPNDRNAYPPPLWNAEF